MTNPNPNTDPLKATVYLQVEPIYKQWLAYDKSDPRSLYGAKVVNATQKKADKPRSGTVEVKITIEIPRGAFVPLQPEATIVIPESLTQPHPVVVEAEDAHEET